MRKFYYFILILMVVGLGCLFLLQNKKTDHLDMASTGKMGSPEKNEKKNSGASLRAPQSANSKSPAYQDINDLKAEFGQGWSTLSQEDGSSHHVSSILVSKTKGPILNERTVSKFVNDIRPVLGVSDAALEMKASHIQENVFDFEQVFNGYKVYGGQVRVITNIADSTPVIINNSLKPVSDLNQEIKINTDTAETIIKKQFIQPQQAMKLSTAAQPVVFALDGGSGELSWIVHAEWIKDKRIQAWDFLVSASDGKVLFQRDLVDN